MTDEFPAPKPRPKLEITFDDLEPDKPPPPTLPYAAPPPPPPAYTYAPPPAAPLPQPPPGTAVGFPATHQHPPLPVGPHPGVAVAAMAINHKSAGVAILLSLLFTGAGQLYCGRAGRGLAFLGAAFVSGLLVFVLVGLILLPIVWIWAAVDAANLANQQNAMLMAAVTPQGQHGQQGQQRYG